MSAWDGVRLWQAARKIDDMHEDGGEEAPIPLAVLWRAQSRGTSRRPSSTRHKRWRRVCLFYGTQTATRLVAYSTSQWRFEAGEAPRSTTSSRAWEDALTIHLPPFIGITDGPLSPPRFNVAGAVRGRPPQWHNRCSSFQLQPPEMCKSCCQRYASDARSKTRNRRHRVPTLPPEVCARRINRRHRTQLHNRRLTFSYRTSEVCFPFA